jgi:menaquinone-dependent protoporphyrinogen oxidase
MPRSILVAYATRNGSTGEVAEAIGKQIRDAGLSADVVRMKGGPALEGRSDVILGAPLYMGSLPGEFHRFLHRNRLSLCFLRAWVFVLGPVHAEPKEFAEARKQAERQLAKYGWLNLAELQIFGGRFDVNHMGFPFSLARHLPMFPAKNMPPTDARDWEAIRGWAAAIAGQKRTAA